ncbi:hypothetical protein SAMN05216360_11716 [Methylobacterium phyllostachyos]|uniref:Uncharacterized protein n=1 Tax=Methylobacterium phyllostachyos TaxID=582672 RepID=A0A1H0HU66_9HYPH|nr:hypothetical protein SAMN05216360_11716 [Methylobacterium phyllostachyos]
MGPPLPAASEGTLRLVAPFSPSRLGSTPCGSEPRSRLLRRVERLTTSSTSMPRPVPGSGGCLIRPGEVRDRCLCCGEARSGDWLPPALSLPRHARSGGDRPYLLAERCGHSIRDGIGIDPKPLGRAVRRTVWSGDLQGNVVRPQLLVNQALGFLIALCGIGKGVPASSMVLVETLPCCDAVPDNCHSPDPCVAAKCHLMRVTGAPDDDLKFQATAVITQLRAGNTRAGSSSELADHVAGRLASGYHRPT